MKRTIRLFSPVAFALAPFSVAGPPATVTSPTTDTYHNVKVADDYRWLEDWNSEKVKAWSGAQNDYARGVLARLPSLEQIRARVSEIMSATTPSYGSLQMTRDGKTLLGMKRQPPKQQSMLVAWDDPMPMLEMGSTGAERMLLDPNTLDAKSLTSIDWFVPSPDGKLVAVSLSKAGSESGDVSVFEIASGKKVFETIPRVNGGTAGGSLAWATDSNGFFYTRYPRGAERPPEDMDVYMQVYFHKFNTPTESDSYEMGRDLPRIAEIQLETLNSKSAMNGAVLACVQKGDGGEFEHYLRTPSGDWKKITTYADRVVQAVFGPDDAIYLISRKDAQRGKLLRMPLETPSIDRAKTIVPEGKDSNVSKFENSDNFVVTDSLIYATYQLGGPAEIRVFSHAGAAKPAPTQLPVSAVGGLASAGGDRLLFSDTSYTEPQAFYLFDPAAAKTTKTPLASTSPVDFSGYEAVREMATSKDGTKVPINIIRKKGITLDGSHPCMVTGYGGFGLSRSPGFNPASMVLLEQGIVLVNTNLRGGAEFGEDWHKNGMLTKKQNVFDDFAAACRFMIDAKYTSRDRLAIQGGSNGGLLMGAALTQHPDLFRVVVSHVGIYDMLRVELSSNGAFNVTEYGTVKDPEQFKALRAYSPYHNVKDKVAYPAILFLTGANDPRVDPMQSRKMTARLQAATSADPEKSPILLRTSMEAGHGGGTPLKERIAEATDVDAFLFWALGVQYTPVK